MPAPKKKWWVALYKDREIKVEAVTMAGARVAAGVKLGKHQRFWGQIEIYELPS